MHLHNCYQQPGLPWVLCSNVRIQVLFVGKFVSTWLSSSFVTFSSRKESWFLINDRQKCVVAVVQWEPSSWKKLLRNWPAKLDRRSRFNVHVMELYVNSCLTFHRKMISFTTDPSTFKALEKELFIALIQETDDLKRTWAKKRLWISKRPKMNFDQIAYSLSHQHWNHYVVNYRVR